MRRILYGKDMKKTQRKDAIRNILKRIVSYLSIVMVITLGLGGFLTSAYVGRGIEERAAEYYNAHKFKNLEMVSSLGIADEDLELISQVEGVQDVEGVVQVDGGLEKEGVHSSATIVSITEKISVPEVIEGKLPESKNECVIGEDFAERMGIAIGDKVRLSANGFEEGNPLLSTEFTVTGLMYHPDYVKRKTINTVVIPLDAFDEEVTEGYFTRAFIRTGDVSGNKIFKKKYFEEEKKVKAALEGITDDLKANVERRVRKKAEITIDDEWGKTQEEFEKAKSEIDKSEKKLNEELAAARKKLEDAEAELAARIAEGESELRAAEERLSSEVASARAQIEEAETKLSRYSGIVDKVNDFLNEHQAIMRAISQDYEVIKRMEVSKRAAATAQFILSHEEHIRIVVDIAGEPDVKALVQEVDEFTGLNLTASLNALANMDVDSLISDAVTFLKGGDESAGRRIINQMDVVARETGNLLSMWNAVVNEVASLEQELADARAELERKEGEGRAEIDAGWSELNTQKENAEAEISSGWDEYNASKEKYEKQIADARKKYDEEYAAAEQKVKEAEEDPDIPESEWVVLDRMANNGYIDIKSNSNAIITLGIALGILFIIITAMVCFTTLVIIIDEQKEMVGTEKAFGFFKREVMAKYLTFGVSAAITGCILGIMLSLALANRVQVEYAATGMYQFGVASSIITPLKTVIACSIIIAICILASVLACTDILKSPASILLKGASRRTAKAGRKKTVSGKGGSLYSRLIVRNMINDKYRVIVSIAIIAFSCMLIGVGITLKLAYDGMPKRQLNERYKYDVRMDIGAPLTDKEKADVDKLLEQNGAKFIPAVYKLHLYMWDDSWNGLYILSGDPDRIGDFVGVNKTGTEIPAEIPTEGILVQNRMREYYGMTPGSEVTILGSSLDAHNVTVVGEFQNYVGRDVVISPEGYEKIFGEYEENCYFIKTNGADIDKLEGDLQKISGNLTFDERSAFADQFESVSILYDIVIAISTGIAILMSLMILTNLANIFLNRKKNELIVMRVNGFSIKKTKGYLIRETVLTTILGVVFGVISGVVVANIVIKLIEQPILQFDRDFKPLAWIIAVAIEGVFALVINSVVFNKIKKFNLKDITQ